MRVLLLEAPHSMLDERRRLGLDGRDEVWKGVVHVVPPARGDHQELGAELMLVLGPQAKRRGLRALYEAGLFRAADDYRVPDQLYCRPADRSERGAEGAELVVEIRSPDDETYAKLTFYAAVGVREVLVVHPDERRVELFRLVQDALLPVSAAAAGEVRSEALDVTLRTVDGALHVHTDAGVGIV